MKKTLIATLTALLTLTGCAVKESHTNWKKTAEYIPSILVDVLPETVACERINMEHKSYNTECTQVRIQGQEEVIVLKANIKGFTPVKGTSYVIDVRQVPVPKVSGEPMQPIWVLNKIISQQ